MQGGGSRTQEGGPFLNQQLGNFSDNKRENHKSMIVSLTLLTNARNINSSKTKQLASTPCQINGSFLGYKVSKKK